MTRAPLLLTTLSAALLLGCSDIADQQLRGGVAVSFATRSPTTGAPADPGPSLAVLLDDTIIDGADTLVITRARLVLREIELKRQETADCDIEPEPAGCEEVTLGPALVDLPLTAGAAQTFAVEVPPGTYTRIDFEIHKVSDSDPADATFRAAHPDFTGVSIRVDGTFNGQAFTFETDLDVEQELELASPMVVDESTNTNVTIFVDVSTWFRNGAGTLVDPATANKGGPNESAVTEHIKQSLKAFEDPDGDGD